MTNWQAAFEEALDELSQIPHPMAEQALEQLLETYKETTK